MTWLGWVLAVVWGLLVLAGAMWLAAGLAARLLARRDGGPARPDLERVTLLPPFERVSYLRHPAWGERCACGQFGLPVDEDGDVVEVRDNGGFHGALRCQPEREAL